jgi:hypothetical protein
MVFVCISNFVLSKKIVSIIESTIGARGLTEMADAAKRSVVAGSALGIGLGFLGLKATGTIAVGTGKGAAWGGSKLWKGFRGTKDGEDKNPAAALNPFGAAAHALRGSFKAGRNASAATGQALNAADNNPPPQ